MSRIQLAFPVAVALLASSLLPAAPARSEAECAASSTFSEGSECPEYTVLLSGTPVSLGGCSGCKWTWSATVIEVLTGNPISSSSGVDQANCGTGTAAHTIRCPGGGTLATFSLNCDSCQ